MRSQALVLVGSLLGLLVGLLPAPNALAQAPRSATTVAWTVDATARLRVGDSAESDEERFGRISDARLLPSGLLAIADPANGRVTSFDASGREVARVGRRGRGPGEFTGSMSLAELGGDAVAIWDPSQRRWSRGELRRGEIETPADAPPAHAAVVGGVMLKSDLAAVPAWVGTRLRAFGDSLPGQRRALLDPLGYLWLSANADGRRWLVFADTASAVAQVQLPPGLTLWQVTERELVGVVSDGDGFQQVVVHGLRRAPSRTTPRADAAARGDAPANSGMPPGLAALLRNAVTAQEAHFADHGRYTGDLTALKLVLPEGARFQILDVTDGGWWGMAWYPGTGVSCAMMIGVAPPWGWSEGSVQCAR